ncbi:GlxA family transcriptional regulator [Paraburkholderia sp. DHOC27]|uniref:GlxA family transcriptional regulator n=1 Tax=Paraburkholderia sp. DHOC27 TaxID=2303330 RepID=UPI000E3EA47D|nr:GlxA family transcriptional regulator [Paraburkholderia sp. DHOC27]RFU49136.1 GlxA family transcriptional regulator [Paraburkholderia sp. DHOC27]
MTHTIKLVVYADFQALALAVGTVFEYANLAHGEQSYDFHVVSESGGAVMSSEGISVNTGRLQDEPCDTLIVAGDNQYQLPPESLLTYIRRAPAHCRRIASVGTGAFVLAEAKLLDGKHATTHWSSAVSFKRRYPNVLLDEDCLVAVDGQIWTSAGMTAGVDLALAMVEEDLGAQTARKVARQLVRHQRRSGGQAQFSALLEPGVNSALVEKVLAYAKAHLRDDLSVGVLAEVAQLSPRQFSRVFSRETGQSPGKAVERLRVEAARLMMETSRRPIEVIARETGFGDRERMRQAFIRAFGQPPQAIQRVSANAPLSTD